MMRKTARAARALCEWMLRKFSGFPIDAGCRCWMSELRLEQR